MACLRDIQRLFGQGKTAFYAGFGNRITDAMSYRSVNIPSSRIFTIDSNGEVRMELLELAGHRSSCVFAASLLPPRTRPDPTWSFVRFRYIFMNDLVDQMFPPVHVRSNPEFTDFNYWRADSFIDVQLPDFSPPSPALSARSDTSGRLSVFRNLTGSLRGSRSSTPVSDAPPDKHARHASTSSGPSSPLFGPVLTSDSELSEEDEDELGTGGGSSVPSSPAAANERRRARASSMPGSLPDDGYLNERFDEFNLDDSGDHQEEDGGEGEEGEEEEEEDQFDDDLLATGEMGSVPF